MNKLKIFKIGGSLIDDPTQLGKFLNALSGIKEKKLIVHDGGQIANDLALRMGHSSYTFEEDAVNENDTMQVMSMVYAGLMNKTITANLNSKGIQSIGISGVDASCYTGKKKKTGNSETMFTAELEMKNVNITFLTGMIWDDYVPVLSPLTCDEHGALLNVNADHLATTIASALSIHFQTELVLCSEKDGVLLDPRNADSIINKINLKQVPALMESNVITGKMVPRIQHAKAAIENGVNKVVICNSNKIEDLLKELRPTGTTIYA